MNSFIDIFQKFLKVTFRSVCFSWFYFIVSESHFRWKTSSILILRTFASLDGGSIERELDLKSLKKILNKFDIYIRFLWYGKTRATSYELRVASYEFFKSASSNARVTSSNPWVTSSNPQVTSSNSQITSSNPRVTCSNSRVTSSNPRVRESLNQWKLK